MCALRLSTKLDADASGFKAGVRQSVEALNDLEQAARRPQATIQGLLRQQEQLVGAMGSYAHALRTANQNSQSFAAGSATTEKAAGSIARSMGLARHQVQNLGYQVTDIGTQLAGGASPFLIMAQQGPQVVDALGGITGAARVAGTALRFLFTNPIGLAITAVASLATAVATLSTHTTTAQEAQDRYHDALARSNQLTRSAADIARELAEAKRQQAIETVKAAQAAERDTVARQLGGHVRLMEQIAVLRKNIDTGFMVDQSRAMLPGLEKTLTGLRKEIDATAGRINTLQVELAELAQPPKESVLGRSLGLGDVANDAREATGAVRTFDDVLSDLRLEAEAMNRARLDQALELVSDAVEAGKTPMDKYREQVARVRGAVADLTQQGMVFSTEYAAAVERGLQAMDPSEAADRAREMVREVEDQSDELRRLSESVIDDWVDGLAREARDAVRCIGQFFAALLNRMEAPRECH